jgi:hypothetical protein
MVIVPKNQDPGSHQGIDPWPDSVPMAKNSGVETGIYNR